MKKLAILLFLGSFALLASRCSKTDSEPMVRALNGKWELWLQGGELVRLYPPGNGNILQFSNGHYTRYRNGTLDTTGTFRVVTDLSAGSELCLVLPPRLFTQRIEFDGQTPPYKEFVSISGDTLSFMSGCFAIDGGTFSKYLRIQ